MSTSYTYLVLEEFDWDYNHKGTGRKKAMDELVKSGFEVVGNWIGCIVIFSHRSSPITKETIGVPCGGLYKISETASHEISEVNPEFDAEKFRTDTLNKRKIFLYDGAVAYMRQMASSEVSKEKKEEMCSQFLKHVKH